MSGLIDLHVHTNKSDGSLSASDVVRLANINRLRAVAITDHNTLDAVEDCMFASKDTGLEIIAGVEISTEFQPELHILAYFFDNRFLGLQSWLYDVRERRQEKVLYQVIERLNELGYKIDAEFVRANAKDGHFGINAVARALVKKRHFADEREAFNKLLGYGHMAYVPFRPSIQEVIEKVREFGGVPVLAHPFIYGLAMDELKELLLDMKHKGLVGIEVYHSEASEPMRKTLEQIADQFGLIKTGGSDYHGSIKPGIELGIGRDNVCLDYEIIEKLKAAAKLIKG